VSLWCRETGWAADTVDGSHFTLRFGPAVDFHGHQDHGGLTWFALGTPVLSDRGLFSKDRGARYDFAHSMAAHSVFEPVASPKYDPETAATRISDTEFDVRDSADGIERQREGDRGARAGATAVEGWLDASWRRAQGGDQKFRNSVKAS
jgi:hypothetical protein